MITLKNVEQFFLLGKHLLHIQHNKSSQRNKTFYPSFFKL